MTLRYRLILWWLGLDNMDRLSVVCSVILLGAVVSALGFLLGVY